MSKKILVTGSSGLIGSEVCRYFAAIGDRIVGLDNNMRATFFGPTGDTRWVESQLREQLPDFEHHDLDIRDRQGVSKLIQTIKPDAIVHTAAQPSHDLAARIPFDDFDVNAVGTLNLLQAAREFCPTSPFVYMSTNKVYGDGPNHIALTEEQTRYRISDVKWTNGIAENFSIDQCKHSLFGASKVAADVMVQEYGRYFDMPTCCLRGGCLTGPNHSGVQLHGFLSYLVRCNVLGEHYTVFGYKGKQVRDNIHSLDVARFIHAFIQQPRCGEVYNIGGGLDNACSILEAFEKISAISGKDMQYTYDPTNRIGDHICYYSDLSKAMAHYPDWSITVPLDQIFQEIYDAWVQRLK
ncbi:MAG: NAD-dependent epimerase [Phycisphaeraceae bacterium]|nr:NAD-dependent epimerase [Phycisphaeraceae bacterium]